MLYSVYISVQNQYKRCHNSFISHMVSKPLLVPLLFLSFSIFFPRLLFPAALYQTTADNHRTTASQVIRLIQFSKMLFLCSTQIYRGHFQSSQIVMHAIVIKVINYLSPCRLLNPPFHLKFDFLMYEHHQYIQQIGSNIMSFLLIISKNTYDIILSKENHMFPMFLLDSNHWLKIILIAKSSLCIKTTGENIKP